MKAYYSDRFVLPLPPGHRFPIQKYELLRSRVSKSEPGIQLLEPESLTDEILSLAHDPSYVSRFAQGDLSQQEIRRIGFPWSAELVERSRRSAGATVGACIAALKEGVGVNLAGGTHHAYRDHAEGYCCFNDAIIASKLLQRDYGVRSIAVIDLDVHQGNGTAAMAQRDPSIFTLSIHGATNYPFRKEQSDLDIELADGTADGAYLDVLNRALEILEASFAPDLVIYLAGADPFVGDRLGRLALSKEGLAARDRRVFQFANDLGLPVAVAMAGGYGRNVSDTVDIHFSTVQIAHQNHLLRKRLQY